ncbi:Zinc transporter 1 [Heracleum sosnowskyi]|uniref:Zinc transporter 1 n=1 Tax=Heracleum sosnowskyi TaxID=360622 RepID=A0AAD8MKN1_9APIA|nr:Zinc transporter 1 [Heracleum sosnowskyi]
MMALHQKLIFLSLLFLIVLPECTLGDSSCESDTEVGNASKALKYKILAIVLILVAGGIGVCLPLLGKFYPALSPEKNAFFIIKAFAAGVILATGFVHVLPDASQTLTSPCLNQNPWGKFPFAGFIAMVSAIGTLMIECYATIFFSNSNKSQSTAANDGENGDIEKGPDNNLHVHSHGHVHESMDPSQQLIHHRVVAEVLELGIVIHSVIIGISLGASQNPTTIWPLLFALAFHQFFEGMGLGGCITQGKFKSLAVAVRSLLFSLTMPVGIGIGMAVSNVYDENSSTALIVEGVFNAASAGILIYMALVDLLAPDFKCSRLQNNRTLQLGANVALLLGAGCMSLLAIWA